VTDSQDFDVHSWSYFRCLQRELRRIGRNDLAGQIEGFRDQVEDMERRVLAVEGLLDELLSRLTPEEFSRLLEGQGVG